jgi:hypothetical protein
VTVLEVLFEGFEFVVENCASYVRVRTFLLVLIGVNRACSLHDLVDQLSKSTDNEVSQQSIRVFVLVAIRYLDSIHGCVACLSHFGYGTEKRSISTCGTGFGNDRYIDFRGLYIGRQGMANLSIE